ncbi:protein phosphatase 2C domain-containing protein [Zavarzinella formosa]|uniref:protein phosphatase 2C domain-containing protein n=1 Tax=Zavarzinella formosa TaxID=360055 RepID=UPI0002E6B1CF|nr:protein phosphatase 2C domain-containing protein [Zavarzinella formosa]
MTEPDISSDSTPLPTEPILAGKSDHTLTVGGDDSEVSALAICPQCQAARPPEGDYCGECGYIFSSGNAETSSDIPSALIGGRYQLEALLGARSGVFRYRGVDTGTPEHPVQVLVLAQTVPSLEEAIIPSEHRQDVDSSTHEFDLPEDGQEQATEELEEISPGAGRWPGTAWEQGILVRAAHLSLPRLIDAFTENGTNYLIEEAATGIPLWEAWDGEAATWAERCGWLIQIAEAIEHLHTAGAILEGLRPEMFVISPSGQAILRDLGELLPFPLPGNVPLKGSFSTAPELVLTPGEATERADLYVFGALLHALLMGRELTELDFNLTGQPRSYIDRCPDVSPYLARVLSKTFVREIEDRFPTGDGQLTDPTGFRELIDTLRTCQRNLDYVHHDMASWSNTGMIRSGNEDAVAIFHSSESRLDDRDDVAFIVLADGMGGMESGEVAAAMAVQTVRQKLLLQPPFAALQTPGSEVGRDPNSGPGQFLKGSIFDNPEKAEKEITALKTLLIPPKQFSADCLMVRPEDRQSPARSATIHQDRVAEAIRFANKQVYDASRYGFGGRGMGCTLEVILIDGPQCVIGHVGDSRVYHMHHGRLKMITRDQTLVSRLVELGHITEEEAETHPRRSELQQAIGGRVEVVPEMVTLTLSEGDWLMACSDGLSNQLHITTMEAVLRESPSAEKAARRLINMAILNGANDNVTVAVVRVS